ncbi:MAG: hypothetical protein ACTSWK_16840 [Promethearchaeota archaeon]
MNENKHGLLNDDSGNAFPEWIMILINALKEHIQKEKENAKA